MKLIQGFSKLTKEQKVDFISKNLETGSKEQILSFWHQDQKLQNTFDEFSENTISNFYLPYGVVPNFVLNQKVYNVPMVIEESSVVAALSKAAKFWSSRGGFKAEIIGSEKIGQVHFVYEGEKAQLKEFFENGKIDILNSLTPLTINMDKRGGGIRSIELVDLTDKEENYYQIKMAFETCDAMGANFINSVLEAVGKYLEEKLGEHVQVIMCILSNYTPNCKARAWVECPIEDLNEKSLGMDAKTFVQKFSRAVRIAHIDPHRATTHNKGIFNGIDGVVIATGNDFRAVEACGHTYAARDGQYRSLTNCKVEGDKFLFEIEIPLALGTVGGLTKLHPLAKMSLDILERPSANELMMITASVGLAQNFAALKSLVTSGIQKGHMKMHLMNILGQLEANNEEKEKIAEYFADKVVSFSAVREQLESLRN
ncbi:hydroxymethylglutaryl-CoA reductase, degradative [Halobacteriovorax sp. XZX-3]|uniref:hydroxymethylglutaryl-CoA reductase, degradative n=1 Tax=unclassified Halobacteriovorax TaxID=2639665 RepID=UPI000CD243FC|nr:hydroxymethylglutaryl-CoA reductase, degradative [Halobacteriovorax sp. DA5]POB14539.1 hydroxymethylglutaryl-CoA reductase, degradative [Halobacteriovorax sp. DA5]